MNKTRRSELTKLIELINNIKETLEILMEEEEEYRDNIPENLQNSEKYEKAQEACDNLQYAIDALDEAVSHIESSQEQ